MSEQQPDDGQNVDAIRDILFGRQMRDYDERFVKLEAALDRQLEKLGGKLSERITQLQSDAEKQLADFRQAQQSQDEQLAQDLAGLTQELQSTRQELITSVSDQIDSLRRSSVSRRDLATLLRDLADQFDQD